MRACVCPLTCNEQGSGGWQNFLGQAALSGQHLASQLQSASVRHSSTQKFVSPTGSGAGHDPGLGVDTDGKHKEPNQISVCLSVCLSVSLSLCLSVCLSLSLSVCLSLSLSLSFFIGCFQFST